MRAKREDDITRPKRGRPSARRGRTLVLHERRALCWELYKAAKSTREISEHLAEHYGINVSGTQVWRDVKHTLDRLPSTSPADVAQYRATMLARIQVAMGAIWPSVRRGEHEAVRVLVRLLDREAKLVGADAPTKIDLTERLKSLAVEEGMTEADAVRVADGVVSEVQRERR